MFQKELDSHKIYKDRVHEAVFGFKEAGLKLGATTCIRVSCNQILAETGCTKFFMISWDIHV